MSVTPGPTDRQVGHDAGLSGGSSLPPAEIADRHAYGSGHLVGGDAAWAAALMHGRIRAASTHFAEPASVRLNNLWTMAKLTQQLYLGLPDPWGASAAVATDSNSVGSYSLIP